MIRFVRYLGVVGIVALVCVCAHGETLDRIVATVGPEVILQSDVVQEIAPLLAEIRQQAASEAEFNRMAEDHLRRALDQAIDGKILLRQALLAGLEVDDAIVEERIADIRKRFASSEEFMKELTAVGETMSDFRTRIRKQIMAISMGMRKRREFERAIEVTEAEVAQYYQDNIDEFSRPERVRVRRIFLKAGSSDADRERARARLAELQEQLAAGADFAELAKTYSAGPAAADGGLIGWVARGDLVESLETPAFALEAGEVSDVLETEYGLVLLKLDRKEAAGRAELDEVRPEIEPVLRAQAADVLFKKWMKELRKRSRVRMFL
ncbi:MAG: hypothetical protein GWP08_08620 [Nitrospiraceae bacterium]|nr:hypothetical protein [Nitrospiraceae bacterium]